LKKIFLILALFFALSFAGEGPVSYYGKLNASGNKMVGSKTGSTPVQIKGVSFGWSNPTWESGRFYTAHAVDRMVQDWKAEVVRAAYGATNAEFPYGPATQNRNAIEKIVDAAIANDIYVIIDWHSHAAHNEVQNSTDFFDYMAQKYGSYDNVIFEIYNEPTTTDGGTWPVVKEYAEKIIPVIRKHSSNLILVGTPQWSQRIDNVVGNAINDNNVGYVFHFYAYSHNFSPTFGTYVKKAVEAGLFVFCTEYSTVHSDGGLSSSNPSHYNTHNAEKADEWLAFMDENKISSAAWNINDKEEGAAFFGIPGESRKFNMDGSWADESKMTESGKYIFGKLKKYAESAPWRSGSVPIQKNANLPNFEQANAVIYSLSGKKIGSFADVSLQNGVYILISKQNGVVQRKILKIVK